ncbi:uncharacterized protein EV422DRAFT_330064 [Fimicolochytrium jonesii]|uniref:uncharacterized protein n=1 Tax=Fimicolochytrium jonesii TaxID=1396493 RepID=UPI0022FEE1D5|nr:uncharacterized protein EV422DRAFT_330064 [Fimicolochytrium jonesii]KAI8816193.1 hypothetical protein EV422DRAFT_330064 [Fimicolochytrium jonesii]
MSCLLDHHFELVMNVTRSLRVIPGTGLFSDIIEYSDDRKDLHMWSSEDMTEFRGTLQYIFEIFEKRNPPGMVWQTSVAALITMPPFAQAYKLLRSTLEMQDAHNRSREELEIMMAYITEGLLGTNKFGIRSAAFECIMTMGQELAPDTFKYLLNMLYENLPKEVPEVRRRRFIDHISNASKEGGGRLRAIMAQKGPASACFRGLWLF